MAAEGAVVDLIVVTVLFVSVADVDTYIDPSRGQVRVVDSGDVASVASAHTPCSVSARFTYRRGRSRRGYVVVVVVAILLVVVVAG